MNNEYNSNLLQGELNSYNYHLFINLYGLTTNRRKIHQLACKYQHLGLHYSLQKDTLSLLCYRKYNDSEIVKALWEIAQLLPAQNCYRLEARNYKPELNFGYLLYGGAVYHIDNLAQPRKPLRIVVGQQTAA